MPAVSERTFEIAIHLNEALGEEGEITLQEALEALAIVTTSTIMGATHDRENAEVVLGLLADLVRRQIHALEAVRNPAEVRH